MTLVEDSITACFADAVFITVRRIILLPVTVSVFVFDFSHPPSYGMVVPIYDIQYWYIVKVIQLVTISNLIIVKFFKMMNSRSEEMTIQGCSLLK